MTTNIELRDQPDPTPRRVTELLEANNRYLERARAAEATVRALRDRYEGWTSITVEPHPIRIDECALLAFYCLDLDGEFYTATGAWDDRPDEAVLWCQFSIPLDPEDELVRLAVKEHQGE
jgi:hypothetical protein